MSYCKSLFVRENESRYWIPPQQQTQYKWGHRIVTSISFCPLIALMSKILENWLGYCICPYLETVFKNRQWVFQGNQAGCDGPVSISRATSMLAKLHALRPRCIQFNPIKIVSSLKGGTCSAMSLEFLDTYFKAKRISIEKYNHRFDKLLDLMIKVGQNFSSSSEEMRNRQAAFNAIEIDLEHPLLEITDYSKNKVQSLANYHSLITDYSSLEIDIDQFDSESRLSHELATLPEGAFFVRILKPANNEKLEEHGHSLVYIKENGLSLFYDPNYGLKNLSSLEHSKTLFEGFKKCLQSFGVSKATFYRMQPG